jgi:hypothetical protein
MRFASGAQGGAEWHVRGIGSSGMMAACEEGSKETAHVENDFSRSGSFCGDSGGASTVFSG